MMDTLVEITPDGFGVDLSLAYATDHNFTGCAIYGREACYLHRHAAERLKQAADLARRQGLRLKVFDAFRPSEAQWVLWNHTPDPDFLADPRRGSPHSKGVAVDLTLVDSRGNDLDMGTPFDAFTSLSHHASTDITQTAQSNRFLLLGLMTSAGWDFYRREWWHYQLFNSRDYPVLDDDVLPEGMMPC